jgi:hypothetical protein
MKRLSVLGRMSAPGAATSAPYHWPVKPFDRQHPIRGAFGDPRTLARDEPFGVTGPDASGSYSFHNGIDIVAWRGTAVYPVVSGRVVVARRDEIVVDTGHERAFQYWHLRGNVRVGQQVVAEQTVLGWTRRPFDAVHLTEIDDRRNENPLAAGHLEPYRDHTKPLAIALDFDNGKAPHLTQGGVLGPNDEIAIEAVDAPAMALPGAFAGLPQTPAVVEWRLRTGRTWSEWHVAADFRQTGPRCDSCFWHVYAAGTYQNSPVFDRRLCRGVAGRYLFRTGIEASRLAPGTYKLLVRVADVRGNTTTTPWQFEVGVRRTAASGGRTAGRPARPGTPRPGA